MDLNPTRRAKDGRAAADGFRNVAFWSCPAWRREAAGPVGGARQSSRRPSWGDAAEKAVQSGGISGDVSVVQKRKCHTFGGTGNASHADIGENAGLSGNRADCP